MQNKKDYNKAIEELSLMLMYLTRTEGDNEYCRYRELSWKGYDFQVLDKLDEEEMIFQPRSRRGYDKYLYLTEQGRKKAQELLAEYGLCDKDLNERFAFRNILPEEAQQAAEIEKICFPPNEACSESMMIVRVAEAPELFLVAVDRETGKIAGFLNGLATDEYCFRDEFFTDAKLHNPNGKNVMLLGLDVLPKYRKQGLAKEIMFQYLRREQAGNRKMVVLTCLKSKVKMYTKMGFTDRGISESTWGGEQWHEMNYMLNL
ncbi:MAG: GNAT family N-acetyltransferase [Lachnospiraceae bacterium]|nr:GNAT family N-acetyltransferase [Lachnospiraceae bacterium]